MPNIRFGRFSPGRLLLCTIVLTIAIGSILLSLPICRTAPLSLLDIIFTATSITCVTGLFTIPLSSFTTAGHIIMLILMQVGGIGLITMTIFMLSLFMNLGLGTQILAGKLLELDSWKQIKHLLFFIIKLTLCIELIGACFIFLTIYPHYNFFRALFLSLFHAVSSFCDAGITLFPGGMITYQQNYPMLIITSILMLCGGLGFIVWDEIIHYLASINKKRKFHFSLHSKITISTTISIIACSIILIWLLERNNTLASMNPILSWLNAYFMAISSRGSGFTSLNPTELQLATLLWIMITAFIGSSPGSTGGGIKTTTFAIVLMTVKTAIIGRNSVQIKGRRIAKDQLFKALAIIALSQFWIIMTTFFLLITEKGFDFLDILFEVVSAFATLGLSLGITPHLSTLGKLFIISTMIIGRIGSLTLVLALRKRIETTEYEYPEERVLLG